MNEVRIIVRTTNAAKAGFEEVEKEIDGWGDKLAKSFAGKFAETLTQNLTQHLNTQVQQAAARADGAAGTAGDRIGDTIGRRASDRILSRIRERLRGSRLDGDNDVTNRARSGGLADDNKVRVEVDVDRESFLQRMSRLGREGASRFGEFFKTGFLSIFSGDIISTAIKATLVTGLVATLGPVLGAGITAAIGLALGGGAIGAGVALAFKDPRIQAAANGIKKMLGDIAADFGSKFRPIVEDFLAPGNKGGGGLVGVLEQLGPQISHLGDVLAPVAAKLGDGIIGMLQNMLPPIIRAIEKSAPIVEKLAEKLPGLGEDIGHFFETISDGAPTASVFLADLIELFGWLLRSIANVIKNLTLLYLGFRTVFMGMIGIMHGFLIGASIAFGWIPGIGPKLKGLEQKFREFRDNANNHLKGIRDRTVNIRIRVLGMAAARAALDVARSLAAMGYAHGGVVGNAASGGARSGMTWVGEHGPELVRLPPGSQVHSTGDSARLAGGQGGGQMLSGTFRLRADRTTERGVVDAVLSMLRAEIGDNFGGDVQLALGR